MSIRRFHVFAAVFVLVLISFVSSVQSVHADQVPSSDTSTSTTSTVGGLGGSDAGSVSTSNSCDQYLTQFIRYGANNDPEQVRRLQRILIQHEHAPITVSGVYDPETYSAVQAFQQKYESDILSPWGIQKPTGYVYLTTRKKINEINCNNTKSFPLSPSEEQKIIESKASAAAPSQIQTALPAVPPVEPSSTSSSASASDIRSTGAPVKGIWQKVIDAFKGTPPHVSTSE